MVFHISRLLLTLLPLLNFFPKTATVTLNEMEMISSWFQDWTRVTFTGWPEEGGDLFVQFLANLRKFRLAKNYEYKSLEGFRIGKYELCLSLSTDDIMLKDVELSNSTSIFDNGVWLFLQSDKNEQMIQDIKPGQ